MAKDIRDTTLEEFEDFLDTNVTPDDVTHGYGRWAQNGKYDEVRLLWMNIVENVRIARYSLDNVGPAPMYRSSGYRTTCGCVVHSLTHVYTTWSKVTVKLHTTTHVCGSYLCFNDLNLSQGLRMEERCQDTMQEFENFYDTKVSDAAVHDGYKDWARKYDNDFETIVHRGHLMVADVLDEFYPPEPRASIYILDVAAGTGRVGREIYDRGFTLLDALDACEPMLEEAKKKAVYQNIICARVTCEPLDIDEGKYDAISCSAAFVEGHLPAESIKEFVRIVKKDGIIAMVGNAMYWSTIAEYSDKMAAVIDNLKQEGKVRVLKKEIRDGYIGDKYQAIIIVLQKL